MEEGERVWVFIIVYISNIFSLIFCNFYMFFRFVLVYMLVFVCLFVHKCMVVQLYVSYGNLNICLRSLQTMRAHSFLNFIFLVIKEKDELYILSLESVTSIQKPINLLRQCIIQSAVCYIITFILVIK